MQELLPIFCAMSKSSIFTRYYACTTLFSFILTWNRALVSTTVHVDYELWKQIFFKDFNDNSISRCTKTWLFCTKIERELSKFASVSYVVMSKIQMQSRTQGIACAQARYASGSGEIEFLLCCDWLIVDQIIWK